MANASRAPAGQVVDRFLRVSPAPNVSSASGPSAGVASQAPNPPADQANPVGNGRLDEMLDGLRGNQ
jgi:hypothetical protein